MIKLIYDKRCHPLRIRIINTGIFKFSPNVICWKLLSIINRKAKVSIGQSYMIEFFIFADEKLSNLSADFATLESHPLT